MDWNDLRFVIAIAETGSLRKAARRLDVSHPTVSRRLAQLEQGLNTKLFERVGTGLECTDEGRDALATAARIEDQVGALRRRISGRNRRISGMIRVSIPTMLTDLLLPILYSFVDTHPAVQLDIVSLDLLANMTQREADVVVRFTSSPPGHLFGRRVGMMPLEIYGSRDYLARHPSRDPAEHVWVGANDDFAADPCIKWMKANIPPSRFRVTLRNPGLLATAIAEGVGIGFCSPFVAARLDLVRWDRSPGFRSEYPLWHGCGRS